jgi:hypothetical protein
MRAKALAVALRTMTESGLRFRDTPVPVAVRGVALRSQKPASSYNPAV